MRGAIANVENLLLTSKIANLRLESTKMGHQVASRDKCISENQRHEIPALWCVLGVHHAATPPHTRAFEREGKANPMH